LTKFGVPLGSGTGRGGQLQPKIKHRFRVRVINFGPIAGGLEFTQQVATCGKPKVQQQAIDVHAYTSIAHYAGKAVWETISITLKDDITNSITALVGHQMQKQNNYWEQTAYAAGKNYKFSTIIEVLDGDDTTVLESWTLEGCFIENFNFGDMDYSSSEYMTIELTVRFDNATLGGNLMPMSPDIVSGSTIG
jgi:hypothetical protein